MSEVPEMHTHAASVLFPVTALADRLGIRWMLTPGWAGPGWTGDMLIVDSTDRYNDLLVWHEIAHWLAASPEQRHLADYGIGRPTNVDDHHVTLTSSAMRTITDGDTWDDAMYVGSDIGDAQEALAVEAMVWYPLVAGRCDDAAFAMTFEASSDFGAFDCDAADDGSPDWHFTYNADAICELFAPLGLDENAVRAWPATLAARSAQFASISIRAR